MKHDGINQGVRTIARRPSTAVFAWIGLALMFAVYLGVFALTRTGGFEEHLWRATYNTAPLVPLTLGAHAILSTQVWPRSLLVASILQIPIALAFAYFWYLGILVLKDLPGSWMQSGFEVRPFVMLALVWQLFQGVTVYAVIALGSLALTLQARLDDASLPQEAEPATSRTLLVKSGEEHHMISHDEIVRITGAGDYSELHLENRTILSTTTLAEFEQRLPDDAFLRAHRSHLVRFDAIARSEPAGNGRTTLHLVDGSHVIASRSGTRLLRDRAA